MSRTYFYTSEISPDIPFLYVLFEMVLFNYQMTLGGERYCKGALTAIFTDCRYRAWSAFPNGIRSLTHYRYRAQATTYRLVVISHFEFHSDILLEVFLRIYKDLSNLYMLCRCQREAHASPLSFLIYF